jgi:N-methylhydantoinase B
VPALFDYSERRMRAALSELPQGSWTFEDCLEGDGLSSEQVMIRARVELDGGALRVDFSDTDDQVRGPINCRPPSAIACAYYVALAIAGGTDLRANEGLFRPVEVVTRPGSLLEASYPAAVCNANIVTTQRVVDVILGALSQAAPDLVCAACSGTMNLLNIGGIDPLSGELFNYIETYGGGQGALPFEDGASGIHTHMTNTRNASIEQIELAYPIVVERYALIDDSGGAGNYRGGLGLERHLRVLSESTTLTLSSDRHQVGPWGLLGGEPGRPGECLLVHPDGTREQLPSKITCSVPTGSTIISRTPGGGGRGVPSTRRREAVESDLLNGYVVSEGAPNDRSQSIDAERTARGRTGPRSAARQIS